MGIFNLIVALCVIAIAFAAKDLKSSGCDDSQVAVGTCTVAEHICYGFHDWEWKYTATATDVASGKAANGDGNFASSSGAAYSATYNLFNILGLTDEATYDCNCQMQSQALTDTCTISVGVCFSFASTADVSAATPIFQAYAYDKDLTGVSGPGFTNSTEAAIAAVTDMMQANPAEAKNCGLAGGKKAEWTKDHHFFDEPFLL